MSKPTITIPWPMQLTRARGSSVSGHQSRNRTFRFDDDEYALLTEAAKREGIEKTALVRWFVINGCNEMLKHLK